MNVFTHCSKGLVYGSSPLIKLRNNTFFRNGFRPNFCFDLNCLSNQLEFMHIEILGFSFWNMKRKQIGNMLQKCNTTKYLIQSTRVQEMQMEISNLIFNFFPSFWFPLREGTGLFSFKICKVKVVWELILPTGLSSNKTWTNRNELVAFARSFYMYAVCGIVQCL